MVLKISRLFHQDQDQDQDFVKDHDQDQDFYFKTKTKTNTIFHVRETPRDEDQGLETTSLLYILHTTQFHLFISAKQDMFSSLFVCPFVC